LSAASRGEAEALLRDELARRKAAPVRTTHTVGSYVAGWLMTADLSPRTFDRYRQHVKERIVPSLGAVPLDELLGQPMHVEMPTRGATRGRKCCSRARLALDYGWGRKPRVG
jgi:hypothetical protein